MIGKKYIKKLPAGVEDLLLDASSPLQVTQIRNGQEVSITKINIDTIPAEGTHGESTFVSIRDYIDNLINSIVNGASGTFTSADGKTITVVNGIITSIT